MLKVDNLSKSYDRKNYAVEELSFEVQSGHILALLGHNGAGKTTTLSIVSTVLGLTAGQVLVDGVDISQADTSQLRVIKRNIGYVSATTNLPEYLTAWECLFYVGQMYGIDDEHKLETVIDELVERFAIIDARTKYLKEFSSGLKKRIAIASVMVNSPRLLLLDEPTAHLDPIGVRLLKEYLRELRSSGVAIVLATHQLDIAEQLADEILIINEGRKIHYGTISDLNDLCRDSDGNQNLEKFYTRLVVN